MVLGKPIEEWLQEFPLLRDITRTKEVFWTNPNYTDFNHALTKIPITAEDVVEAENRLNRFAPFIAAAFPETAEQHGIIESPIIRVPHLKEYLDNSFEKKIACNLLLKCDSHLPISGSIKARGGIYEVLKHAEDLAIKFGLLSPAEDYSLFDSDRFRDFFAQYSIAVGSTGNLGLGIGIIGAKLGFNVTVHMSAEAKQWKKDLLRSKGVKVLEYLSDYSSAVAEGRRQAEKDPKVYFVDDEKSHELFLGYAVAASRLKEQLKRLKVTVDEDHPLFVYLPCGVGGGPGGIAFGLKLIYRDHVHCFFAEPTHSPCMLLGSMTGEHDNLCIQDFGIDNKTAADGLAVGRSSRFIGVMMENLLSGIYTVNDDVLYGLLSVLANTEGIYVEPSALAGMPGLFKLAMTDAGEKYLEKHGLKNKMSSSTHIIWATGGNMVPEEEMNCYYRKGIEVRQRGFIEV